MIIRIFGSLALLILVFVVVFVVWGYTALKFLVWDHRAFSKMEPDFTPRRVWREGIIEGIVVPWEK